MPTMVHYTIEKGNSQHELQLLANNVLEYGEIVNTYRSTAQEFSPNGDKRIIETGHTSYEVKGMDGKRYWVHFSMCKVTEIIEAYQRS